ncbi:MAG TPA: hypothetical protein VKF59_04900, partial [Candidatus Dormibacteraeota bacterium]|nr:hypothetical protein [Candidatus Dormibacteraeota bacterium]
VPTPNVQGSIFNELRAVAAVSSSDVWAVGSASTTNNNLAVIEHWDGTQWSMVPTPPLPTQSSGRSLNAVAVVSASDVWAVGSSVEPLVTGSTEHALLMHWDGQAWTLTAAPAETSSWSSSTRTGVAAVSSSDVWAVGDFFAFHWDGSAWSVSAGSTGKAVTAADATDVWAVGTATFCDNEGGGCVSSPTALRWNGSQWLSTSPVGQGGFAAAGAINAADVWAVGGGQAQNWNGSAWTVVPTASVSGATTVALQSVTGSSAHDVWAVGYSQGPGLVVRTLIEHFTG